MFAQWSKKGLSLRNESTPFALILRSFLPIISFEATSDPPLLCHASDTWVYQLDDDQLVVPSVFL